MKKSGRRYSRLEPGPTQSLRTLSFDNREIIFHPARFRPSLLLPVLEADEEEFFRLIQNGVVEDLDEYVKVIFCVNNRNLKTIPKIGVQQESGDACKRKIPGEKSLCSFMCIVQIYVVVSI